MLLCSKAKIADDYPDFGIDFTYNIRSDSNKNTRGHFSGPKNGVHRLLKMLYADDLSEICFHVYLRSFLLLSLWNGGI